MGVPNPLPSSGSAADAPRDSGHGWIERSAPRALAYAISLVRDRGAAEDLVQECFQRLLEKADRYDLPADGTRLLFKAVTNACINWTQRRPPVVSLGSIDSAADLRHVQRNGEEPAQTAMLRELSAAVDSALAELPVDQRAAVELHAMGHSSVEIAEILDLSSGNARVLLHRGRQRLADRLAPFLEN